MCQFLKSVCYSNLCLPYSAAGCHHCLLGCLVWCFSLQLWRSVDQPSHFKLAEYLGQNSLTALAAHALHRASLHCLLSVDRGEKLLRPGCKVVAFSFSLGCKTFRPMYTTVAQVNIVSLVLKQFLFHVTEKVPRLTYNPFIVLYSLCP